MLIFTDGIFSNAGGTDFQCSRYCDAYHIGACLWTASHRGVISNDHTYSFDSFRGFVDRRDLEFLR